MNESDRLPMSKDTHVALSEDHRSRLKIVVLEAAEVRMTSAIRFQLGRPCINVRFVMNWTLLFIAGLLEIGWAVV